MIYRILLIEDDFSIREMLQKYLNSEGFELETSCDGEDGYSKFLFGKHDLILLDIMLPKLNGMDVMQSIRKHSNTPIILLSAKDTDVDKSIGLGLGADDYITKPFSMVEILARIKAAIRRSTQYANNEIILKFRDIQMNLEDYSVIKYGEKVKLTAKEFEILKLFIKHPKKVFTKTQVYSEVWCDNYCGDENVINTHISRLREKIEDDPKNPVYIQTLWGIGYKLGVDLV